MELQHECQEQELVISRTEAVKVNLYSAFATIWYMLHISPQKSPFYMIRNWDRSTLQLCLKMN